MTILLFIAEREYYLKLYHWNAKLEHYENMEHYNVYMQCLWLALVSGFTVGYGGIVPMTCGGRIIIVLIVLVGAFFTSFLIALLTKYVEFTPNESQACENTLLQQAASRTIIAGMTYKKMWNQRYVNSPATNPHDSNSVSSL